jgi:hypothetical protein
MKERIRSQVFSLSGLSLALGALGFLSGIVQLFIDTSTQISVKWLLLACWISLSLVLVFLKLIYDLSMEREPAQPFEIPIKFIPQSQIFVIRRNDNFLNNIVVGCYVQQDEVDTLACLGVVHIVQEKVIQIKVIGITAGIEILHNLPDTLSRIIIRPVVPLDALNQLNNPGTENE